jgi:hypothetical protein
MTRGANSLILAKWVGIVSVILNDPGSDRAKKLPAAVAGIIVNDDQLKRKPRVAPQIFMENFINGELVVNGCDDADHYDLLVCRIAKTNCRLKQINSRYLWRTKSYLIRFTLFSRSSVLNSHMIIASFFPRQKLFYDKTRLRCRCCSPRPGNEPRFKMRSEASFSFSKERFVLEPLTVDNFQDAAAA